MNGNDIALTLLLTAVIEFLTVVLRLVWHLKSAKVQHKMHWPRTHHSYLGALIIVLALVGVLPASVASRTALIVGAALVLSDILHHIALVPLLRRYRYDVRMVHHEVAHRYLVRWSVVVFIAAGVLTVGLV